MMLKRMILSMAAGAGLALLSSPLAQTSVAYTIRVVDSQADVMVFASAGSETDGPLTKTRSRIAAESAQATFVEAGGDAQYASSLALAESFLVPGVRRVRTNASMRVRSRADLPLTGAASAEMAGRISFEIRREDPLEGLNVGLRLETDLENESDLPIFYVIENKTTGIVLFDSDVQGFPVGLELLAHVADVIEIRYGGSMGVLGGDRDSLGTSMRLTSLLTLEVATIPEPGTAVLAAAGLATIGLWGRRRSRDAWRTPAR